MDTKNIQNKRNFIGRVVSVAMDKTIVARVERMKLHPKYNKFYKVSRNYTIHDEKKEAKMGDNVKFEECRPLSKTKRWRLVSIIK